MQSKPEIEVLTELVDIYKLPIPDKKHLAQEGIEITLGDLHGNAIKLLFALVKHGIIVNLDKAQYAELVDIYKTPVEKLSAVQVQRFTEIICSLECSDTKVLFRLLGDDLADRGMNDYFTLLIFFILSQYKVNVEIIISNHGLWFIEAMELFSLISSIQLSQEELQAFDKQLFNYKSEGNPKFAEQKKFVYKRQIEYALFLRKLESDEKAPDKLKANLINSLKIKIFHLGELLKGMDDPKAISFNDDAFIKEFPNARLLPLSDNHQLFSNSLSNMQFLISKGLINILDVLDMYQHAYQPMLKAMSYTIHEQGKAINLHTHARSGLRTIKDYSKLLNGSYHDRSSLKLGMTIETINKKLPYYLKNNLMHSLYEDKNIDTFSQKKNGEYGYVPHAPLEVTTWNRTDNSDLILPEKYLDYKLYNTHGHNLGQQSKNHIFNLDNILGKAVDLNVGIYTALYSKRSDYVPDLKQSLNEDTQSDTPKVSKLNPNDSYKLIANKTQAEERNIRKMGRFTVIETPKAEEKNYPSPLNQLQVLRTEIDDHQLTKKIQSSRLKSNPIEQVRL